MSTYWTLLNNHDSLRGGKTPTSNDLGKYQTRPLPRKKDDVLYGERVWKVIDTNLVPKEKRKMWPDDVIWIHKVINYNAEYVAVRPEDLVVLCP